MSSVTERKVLSCRLGGGEREEPRLEVWDGGVLTEGWTWNMVGDWDSDGDGAGEGGGGFCFCFGSDVLRWVVSGGLELGLGTKKM